MIRIALVAGLALLPEMALAEGDPVVGFAPDDPEMAAAIRSAQRTLPLFLINTVDDAGYGPEGGFLKVAFETGHVLYDKENIWVGPFRAIDGQTFVGLLANAPNYLDGVVLGDAVEFQYDMIVDWSLAMPDGRTWGDYTTRVVVGRLSAAEAAPFADRFADPPAPESWGAD